MVKVVSDGGNANVSKMSALRKLRLNARSLKENVLKNSDLIKGQTKKTRKLTTRLMSKNAMRVFAKKQQENNPFDLQISKNHFDVLNRKVVGAKGCPGVSRRKNMEKRYKSLSEDLYKENRKGKVIDRRFGESNRSEMSEERKLMVRFAKERKKEFKKGLYNLDNDDLAQNWDYLSSNDDQDDESIGFDDSDQDDESDDNGRLTYDEVSAANFGGFKLKKKGSSNDNYQNLEDTQPPPKKTRAEIISEIIEKSKHYRDERKVIRQENTDIVTEIDKNVSMISNLLPLRSSIPAQQLQSDESNLQYDSYVVDLFSESRSKPTDAFVTEKQKAELETKMKKTVEQMQNKRKDDKCSHLEDTQTPDSYVDNSLSYLENKLKSTNTPLAYQNGKLLLDNDFVSDCDDLVKKNQEYSPKQPSIQHPYLTNNLPHISNAPQTVADLISLLENRKPDECGLIINNICNHSANLESKKFLKTFTVLLIEYIYYYCDLKNEFDYVYILPIFVHVVRLARQFREVLDTYCKKRFRKLLSSTTISVADCLLFSLVINVNSDQPDSPSHALGLLAMCKQLSKRIDILSMESLFIRLWSMEIIIDTIESSRNYIPELLLSISHILRTCMDPTTNSFIDFYQDISKFEKLFALPTSTSNPTLAEASIINLSDIKKIPVLIFLSSLKCINRLIQIYSPLPGFHIVFLQFLCVIPLSTFEVNKLNPVIKSYYAYTTENLQKASTLNSFDKQTGPISFQNKFKNVPIKMETPKFFDDYSADHRTKKSTIISQKQKTKLINVYKREKRGALRDLRRDAAVLSDIKAMNKQQSRLAHEKTMKSILGQLAQQEGEERAIERKKHKRPKF